MPVLFVGEFAKLRRAGTLRYAWHASRLRDAGVSAFLHMFAFWHFPDLERSPTCVRKGRARSSGRCNTALSRSAGVCKSQGLAWTFIELQSHCVQLALRYADRSVPFGRYAEAGRWCPRLSHAARDCADHRSKRRCWSQPSSAGGPQSLCRDPRSGLHNSLGIVFACLTSAETTVCVSLLATFVSVT